MGAREGKGREGEVVVEAGWGQGVGQGGEGERRAQGGGQLGQMLGHGGKARRDKVLRRRVEVLLQLGHAVELLLVADKPGDSPGRDPGVCHLVTLLLRRDCEVEGVVLFLVLAVLVAAHGVQRGHEGLGVVREGDERGPGGEGERGG